MTSTSQEQENEKPEAVNSSVEQEQKAEDKQTGPSTVPVKAIAEQRQKTRDAQARIDELEKLVARLESQVKQAAEPQQALPAGELQAAMVELVNRDRTQKLAGELGLSSWEQADIVRQVMAEAPKLSAVEALDVAARRKPELFQDRGSQPGYDKSTFGSIRTTPGSRPGPAESDFKRRIKYADSLPKQEQRRIFQDMLGNAAAKAMGIPHQMKQIP